MIPFHTILTHPGSAHKDEFLACAVLLAMQTAPILRREPTEADLNDPSIAVVDVGDRHEPQLNNFDHHQLPTDAPPTCALSLVLQALQLYESAREFCDWLELTEWLDCRGPTRTAKWLGVEDGAFAKTYSPVDAILLRRFARADRHGPGEPIWEIMRMIGQDVLTYVKIASERRDFLAANTVTHTLSNGHKVIFLSRTDPRAEEAAAGLIPYVASLGRESKIVAMIYPDRRSTGYALARYKDHPLVDFRRVVSESEVHFVHASGFVAKTRATRKDRLLALVEQAMKADV